MASLEGDGVCVELWASDGHAIEVVPAVASQLGVIRKRIIEPCKKRKTICPRLVYQLPGITGDTLEAVVVCCKGFLEPPEEWPLYKNYVAGLHLRTLFNVIQAAYHLQIERLMDLSCEALRVKVEGKQCQQIIGDSVIDPDNVQILNDAEIFSFFRKRSQEVTKNESLFVYKQCPPLMKTHLDFVDRRKNNFLRIVSIMMTACMVNGEMQCVLKEMHVYVSCDPGLADHLDHAHVECLVNIVRSDISDISSTDVKGLALNILAYVTSEVYDEVRQAIPLLLKLSGVQDIRLRLPALVALYSLANAFPVYREDVIDGDALEELLLIVDDFRSEILLNAARLLDVVCRGSNLAPRQIEVAHNISLVLFEKLYDHPDYETHMVHTCSALRYLYDNGPLEMGEKFLTMLMGLLLRSNFSSNCAAVSWSALGVVGNIVRLGKDDKIKFLISRCKLLQCLVTVMITRQGKDFHMEACRIISNISIRNRTLIEEMDKANMITILCSLLQKSDYDVKLEAAWAIFTGIYGNRKLKIDVYPKWKDDFDDI